MMDSQYNGAMLWVAWSHLAHMAGYIRVTHAINSSLFEVLARVVLWHRVAAAAERDGMGAKNMDFLNDLLGLAAAARRVN